MKLAELLNVVEKGTNVKVINSFNENCIIMGDINEYNKIPEHSDVVKIENGVDSLVVWVQ